MQQTQEIQIGFLGQEGPLEEGTATHSSILAWRIPWTEEPGRRVTNTHILSKCIAGEQTLPPKCVIGIIFKAAHLLRNSKHGENSENQAEVILL